MSRRIERCLLGTLLAITPALGVTACTSESSGSASSADSTGTSATGSPGQGAGPTGGSAPTLTIRGRGVLVSGTAPQARLRTVATDAERAIRDVRALWGSSMLADPVRVYVPRDTAGFRSLGGTGGDTGPEGAAIAATTTPDGAVVLSPRLFEEVTGQGVLVVLTHELTHVALGQARLTWVPRWVIEGSAEVTAFAPTGLRLAQAAPTLAGRVRAGQVPAAPPADTDFTKDADAAYQGAYAWCRFLFERYGATKFTRFVRAADARQPDAFHQVFGVQPGTLTADYQQFLRAAVASAEPSGTASSGR